MTRTIMFTSLVIALTTINIAQAADFEFRYAHSQSAEHSRSESMRYFEEQLEKRSDGRINVTLHFDGTLGTESELIQQVQMGLLQGHRGGMFAQANPAYQLFIMPFLFDNPEQALAIMNDELGEEIASGARENGIHIPATGIVGGMRLLTNDVRPVERLADMQGLKIRTPPMAASIRGFEAMGASAQQIAYTETYMALQTGVVDGQENPASNIYDMRFHEVQDYLTLLNWQIHPDPFYISSKWYDSLPADLREVVDEVAEETIERSAEIWLSSEAQYLEQLSEVVEVNEIDPEARTEFVSAMLPVWQHFVEKGDFTQSQLDRVLEQAGKAEVTE